VFASQGKSQREADAKAMRHAKDQEVIAGRRETRLHQQELERRALDAVHDASYAGLMSPFNWGSGADESGAATAAAPAATANDDGLFSRFSVFS
jgi:hypothetical protein